MPACRVEVRVNELSGSNVKVTGGDPADVTLAPSQTRTFSVGNGQSLTLTGAEAVDPVARDDKGEPLTDISEGNHGNPNGPVTAAIGPSIPKPGGNTVIEPDPAGGLREVTPGVDPARMRAAGGPDAEQATESATPGPKPTTSGAATPRRDAAADRAPTPPRGRASPKTSSRPASKKSRR